MEGASGRPLRGVPLEIVIEIDQKVKISAGILASDGAGYASFDLGAGWEQRVSDPVGLFVLCVGRPALQVDVRLSNKSQLAKIDFIIGADAALVLPAAQRNLLASIPSPDLMDWEISPHSFTAKMEFDVGEDDCSRLELKDRVERRFNFFKVVLDPLPVSGTPTSNPAAIDVSASLPVIAPDIQFGYVFDVEQEWTFLGHALGDILNSIPLAPCQSEEVAVIEWSRTDEFFRSDEVTARERLGHNLNRDRTIEESVRAAVEESQSGFSLLGGIGAAASAVIPLQIFDLGISGSLGLGAGFSSSSGTRNIEADTSQEIHDAIVQRTTSTRSLTSVVAVSATQAERNFLTTKTLTNHNHSHALTVQYFSVTKNYKICTRIPAQEKRRVVMLPFSGFPFTRDNIIRFRTIMEGTLLDPSLRECFDALVRVTRCPDFYLHYREPGEKPAIPQPVEADFMVGAVVVDTGIDVRQGQRIRIKADGIIMDRMVVGGAVVGFPWTPDGDALTAGAPPTTMRNNSLVIGIDGQEFQGGARKTILNAPAGRLSLKSNFVAPAGYGGGEWHVTVEVDTPFDEAAQTISGLRKKAEDECCAQRLIAHLEGNRGYYLRSIWMLLDATESVIFLRQGLSMRPDILNGIDGPPLAVYGHYVVFPYVGASPAFDASPIAEKEPNLALVSLPTRGIFAEAMLGSCNASEKRDPTRFWRWEESPCERPPRIEGITPGPRGDMPTVQPTPLPGPVIQIAQPPDAPDPVGMAAALQLLGQPNIFRDMSGMAQLGSLLNGLVSGTMDLQRAQQLARQAQNSLANSAGAGAGPGAPTRPQSSSDLYDKMAIVDDARRQGLIDETAASDAARRYLDADSGRPDIQQAGLFEDVRALLDPATRARILDHLVTWVARNFDPSTGKPDLHIDQLQLALLGQWEPALQALRTVKFQYHEMRFSSNRPFAQVAAAFDQFATFFDISIITCQKLSPGAGIAVRDEFRYWLAPVKNDVIEVIRALLSVLRSPIEREIFSALTQRQFDIRVVYANVGATEALWAVQTLSNHPYSGRRAWRVTQTAPQQFLFQTADFNTFPWIIDYWAEIYVPRLSGGPHPSEPTWQRFMTSFVNAVGGTITDQSRAGGKTLLIERPTRTDTVKVIAADPDAVNVLRDFPPLKEEFDRLSTITI